MKKLILLFVCALLSFTFVNASDVSEIESTYKKCLREE